MKKIAKQLRKAEKNNDVDLYLHVFSDGSGFVKYSVDDKEAFSFQGKKDLLNKLKAYTFPFTSDSSGKPLN
jgi:hypothetical protein